MPVAFAHTSISLLFLFLSLVFGKQTTNYIDAGAHITVTVQTQNKKNSPAIHTQRILWDR